MSCVRSASWLHIIGWFDPRFRLVLQRDDINFIVTNSDIDLFANSVVIRVPVVSAPFTYIPDE